MNQRCKLPALLTAVFAFASVGFGQFAGEFYLTPASSTYNIDQSGLVLDGWTLNLSAHNSGQVDATGGAGSLSLKATGTGGINGFGAGTTSLTLSHIAAGASDVSFNLSGSGTVKVDNVVVSPVSGTLYDFVLGTSSVLALQVSATGTPGTVGQTIPFFVPASNGSLVTNTLAISNFTAVAVPEPASVAAFFGVVGLSLAAWRRRSGRA